MRGAMAAEHPNTAPAVPARKPLHPRPRRLPPKFPQKPLPLNNGRFVLSFIESVVESLWLTFLFPSLEESLPRPSATIHSANGVIMSVMIVCNMPFAACPS